MKRSLSIAGHRTSVSLEDAFWLALRDISIEKDQSIPEIIAEIDRLRKEPGLSSAIRVYILNHYRQESEQ